MYEMSIEYHHLYVRILGSNVPRLVDTNTFSIITTLSAAEEYVVKAQVHAGGRGKGHFDTGFKSGVHLTKE